MVIFAWGMLIMAHYPFALLTELNQKGCALYKDTPYQIKKYCKTYAHTEVISDGVFLPNAESVNHPISPVTASTEQNT